MERVRRSVKVPDYWLCCYARTRASADERTGTSQPATALQVLKRRSSRKLRKPGDRRVWQKRYYDFNVFSARKRTEKLRYMHRNPVKRGLVQNPEDWKWSSYRHYLTGTEGVVEIESHWLARQRERMGIVPKLKYTKLKESAD